MVVPKKTSLKFCKNEPGSTVRVARASSQGPTEQVSQVSDQLSDCRFFGTAVGNSSASDESSLNFSTCKREMQSARLFCKPGTWLARNNMLYFKQLSTRIMTCLRLDVCLFIISTRATLSVKNKTQLFAMGAPQIWTAR